MIDQINMDMKKLARARIHLCYETIKTFRVI